MLARYIRALAGRQETPSLVLLQRRRSLRAPCYVPVQCDLDGTRVDAHVVCISEDGLRLRLYHAARAGTRVVVHYRGAQQLDGVASQVAAVVRWARQVEDVWHVGMAFDANDRSVTSSWVFAVLRRMFRSTRRADDRRYMRYAADLEAAISILNLHKSPWPGRVIDVSLGGVLFEGAVIVPLGVLVEVSLRPRGGGARTLRGLIVSRSPAGRAGSWRVGIRFERVTSQIREWLERLIRDLA